MSELTTTNIEDSITMDSLDDLLNSLIRNNETIIGAFFVSLEGQIMAANTSSNLDERKVAALGATLLSMGQNLCMAYKKGHFEHAGMMNEHGNMIVLPAGPNSILVVETTPEFDINVTEFDFVKSVR